MLFNLYCFNPWLDASKITLSIFKSLSFFNILWIFTGSIEVLLVFKFYFFDKTPRVPIVATFFLFKDNIW